MGIGPAIIQKKHLSKDDLNQIYSATIYIGVLFASILFGSSYFIASFYEKDLLIPICQILSINLLFSALNIVPNALILKAKRFKFIAQRTLILQVLTGILSVFAALKGLGVYSLLISPLITAIGVFFINFRQYPLTFHCRFKATPLKEIASYSTFQFLFNFLNYFSRNLDSLIIGKHIGLSALGYYEKSYKLMMLPLQTVTNVITPVMHPILSVLQNSLSELAHRYNKIVKLLATISFPLGILFHFTGGEIINIVYGNNWDKAIPIFNILALSLPFQMILSSTGSIYQAAGKTNWLFYNGLSNTFFTASGFIISALFFDSLEAFAWAWNISLTINVFISYWILYKKVLLTSIIPMLKELYIPFLNIIIVTPILLIMETKMQYETNIYASFAIKVALTLVVSYLCIQLGGQYNINKIIKELKGKSFPN